GCAKVTWTGFCCGEEIPLSASAALASGKPAGKRDVAAVGAARDVARAPAPEPARERERECARGPEPLATAISTSSAASSASPSAPRASLRLRLRLAASARRLRLWPGVRNGEVLMLGEDCAARR